MIIHFLYTLGATVIFNRSSSVYSVECFQTKHWHRGIALRENIGQLSPWWMIWRMIELFFFLGWKQVLFVLLFHIFIVISNACIFCERACLILTNTHWKYIGKQRRCSNFLRGKMQWKWLMFLQPWEYYSNHLVLLKTHGLYKSSLL